MRLIDSEDVFRGLLCSLSLCLLRPTSVINVLLQHFKQLFFLLDDDDDDDEDFIDNEDFIDDDMLIGVMVTPRPWLNEDPRFGDDA